MVFIVISTYTGCSSNLDTILSNEQEIKDYIGRSNLEYTSTTTGLYYSIIDSGEVEKPSFSSTVIIRYEIYQLDGDLLEKTPDDSSVTIDLDLLIEGLSQGIRLIGRGGHISLLIPSTLAYGSRGNGDVISGDIPLRMEVTLIEFYTDITDYHHRLILSYLQVNGLPDSLVVDDVYYTVDIYGRSPFVSDSSIVTISYRGYLLDGTVFNDTYVGLPGETIPLYEAIEGWQVAVPLFGVGGRGTLFIPSPLAYGADGTDLVPSNSPVVYDFEIRNVQ
jgi:FKBP-type peptidyl-prolyl cis-trans isomerase FkpA